jgi:hypothetical protein
MAEVKTIELHIKSNVDTASKEFDNFAKSIKAVDTSASNLDATFEEVYGDLQPLTTRMGEAEDRLYELALAGKQSSQEFKDLLTSVGNYRKTQIQTDLVVDAAATTLSQKLTGSLNAAAGAFSLVQGSMTLFGSESKDVEQAILKVQSAMAISQGVETITEGAKSVRALGAAIQATTAFQKVSAAAQWLWNAAMNANPIGALVLGVTALIAAGYKLVQYFRDSAEANNNAASATKRNTEALKQQSTNAAQSSNKLKTYNDQQYALAQAAGASSEELRKLALKHKEEEIALNKKNAVLAQSTFLRERDTLASLKNSGASDEVIANQEKLTKQTYDSFKKQNEILSTSYKERAALRNANAVGEVSDAKAAADKAAEKAKEAREKSIEKEKQAREKAAEEKKSHLKEVADFENNLRKTNEDLSAKTDQEKLDLDKKRDEDEINRIAKNAYEKENLQALLNEKYFNLQLDLDAKEKKIKDDKAQADLVEKEAANLTIANDIANTYDIRLAAIAEREAAEKDIIFKSQEEKTAYEKANSDARKKITEEEYTSKINMLKEASEVASKLSELAGEDTAAGKALAIASATINTYVGVTEALKQKSTLPSPFDVVAKVANVATVLATGFKAVKAITSVQIPGGGGGGGAAPSMGGVSAAPTATAAPTFNVVGTSGQNQIAQTLGNQAPVKAYVVGSDVSTQQSLDRNIVKTATIGN